MTELLLWVNENEQVIGYGEKIETHVKKKLHRAFSIFIIDRVHKKILLQKRAKEKYHSGGLWSNSCCSHWRKDETILEAIIRCVKDELGIILTKDLNITKNPLNNTLNDTAIIYAGKFQYFSEYENLAENEIDYVFVFYVSDEITDKIIPDQREIEDIKWIDRDELKLQIDNTPQIFTSWFRGAYDIALNVIGFGE